jgi:hypothetical protein
MSFNSNEYAPTHRAAEAIEREEYEIALYEEQIRMKSYDAGICSIEAAIAGGARYARELAESALEMREFGADPNAVAEIFGGSEHVAAPVIAALNGWRHAVTIAQKAA